jgi:hypothetical protein
MRQPESWDTARFAAVLFVLAFLIRLALVIWLRDMNAGPTTPSTNDDYEFTSSHGIWPLVTAT